MGLTETIMGREKKIEPPKSAMTHLGRADNTEFLRVPKSRGNTAADFCGRSLRGTRKGEAANMTERAELHQVVFPIIVSVVCPTAVAHILHHD